MAVEDEGDDLAIYLRPRGKVPGIGEERGRRVRRERIARYDSPHGSVRYVAYRGQRPVSVLQVMDFGDGRAVIANVYTAADQRRQGWARLLLNRARHDFEEVEHARHLSPLGQLWARAVRDPARIREEDRPLARYRASYEAFARRIIGENGTVRNPTLLRQLATQTRYLTQRRDLERVARELVGFYPRPPATQTSAADQRARELFEALALAAWRPLSGEDDSDVRSGLAEAFAVLADAYDEAGDPRDAAAAEKVAEGLHSGLVHHLAYRAETAARSERPFNYWERRDGS